MVITKTNRIISFILVVCMLFSMLPTTVFASETNTGSVTNTTEVEDTDKTIATYTVKYYKDSIEDEANLLGQYQVNSYVDYEINFDEVNLNTYLPEGYDGGIVVQASSDNVVKADGSSIVYVLYTPATPEGQELLNKVKAENEVVEDITEHIVYIEDYGYDQYALNFATNVSTIKSDTIPTDTILVVDGSLSMLNQTINQSVATLSEGDSTITGEDALYGMLLEFIEYYYDTQPDNSKLGIVIYGYNSMQGYDTVVELTQLGDSTADAFINAIQFPKSDWDWANGVYALKKAKDMFLEAEHQYQGQDGNYYDRARHVIFFGSNSFANYQTFNESSVYDPATTSNQEALNQATFIKGQLGDILMANNVGATLNEGQMLAHYEYGIGHMSATDKNEAWKNFVINDGDTWSHTAGNFDRIQEGAGATFHTVGLFTSKLSTTRRQQAEALFKEMADDGEFYVGDNTADLYTAITDIIADMYVANDVYVDVIVDNNFKILEAPLADRILRNSDDTTTVMYGPLKADGVFHISGDITVAAKEETYKEAPTYRIIAYTYVNGNKVILTQHDTIADVIEEELNSKNYTPISSFEYELVGTTVALKKFIGEEKAIKIAPSYNINGNIYKVTKIGDNCFEGSNITSIEMSEKITKIGMEAFKDCASLTEVKLPENLKALYNGVFMNCTSLQSIEFPDSMYYLGSYAFYNTGLTHADVVDTITYMGMYCFAECADLVSVDLSKKLQRVANHSFENCANLKEVVLPENVYAINDHAFNGCAGLTEAIINEECYFIGQNAFSNCPNIMELQIPCTAMYDLNAFENSNFHTVTVVQGKYEYSLLANYSNSREYGSDGGNYLNSVWQAHKDSVKKIVFKGCTGSMGDSVCENMDILEEVVIEEGITNIGHYDFYDCDGLVTLKFPDSLEAIPYLTASQCDNLKNLDLGEGITFIGYGAFSYSPELEELVIPDSVTGVDTLYTEHGPFIECPKLWKLTMPISFPVDNTGLGSCPITDITLTYGQTGIGEDYNGNITFHDIMNSGLNWESVVVEHGITQLGDKFFATSLVAGGQAKYISLPSTLEIIDASALDSFRNITEFYVDEEVVDIVVFPNLHTIEAYGMSQIGRYTFDVFDTPLKFEQNIYVGEGAFQFSAFPEIIFENGASYIGPRAFENSKAAETQKYYNLTGVDIIDDYAFSKCSAMETCTIGDDLTYIGTHAFDGSGITELVLGAKLETIESDAFIGASGLMHIFVDEANEYFVTNEKGTILWNKDKTEILWVSPLYEGELYIPAGTTLTADLVKNHDYITKITFEARDDLKEIPTGAFADMDGLIEITLPEGVEIIGGDAFYGCDKLKTINLPSTLKEVGVAAFKLCASLETLVIPESVTSVGGESFYECYRLETLYLPSTLVKTFSVGMFYRCYSLANIYLGEGSTALSVNEGNTALMNYDGSVVYWTVDHVTTTDMTEIADYAYQNNTTLKRINITDTVIRIGKYAFHNSGLAGVVTIPSSVTEIGTNAFESTYVKELVVNANITTIPQSFASNSKYLTKVTLPETITTIGTSAFSGCTSLETIAIPSGVTVLSDNLFNNCTSLKNVTLNEGLTTINGSVFYNNTSLESLTISASVTSINSNTFTGCTNLHITVAEGNANYSTNADGTILYNKNKTSIIWYNSSLTTIDLSDSNLTTIPSIKNNTTVEKVILPATATTISASAYQNCTSLTEIVLNEGLTTLNGYTFYGCSSLKELTLPSTMTTVNVTDFKLTSLEHIYVAEGNTTFTTNEDNTALYNADKTVCYWAVEYFRNGDKSYNEMQTAINEAANGDVIYVTNHFTMLSHVTIPANKELTFMPLDKDVTIYQNDKYIANNSKITIVGNNGYTLTFKTASNIDQFNAYADIEIGNGAILWGNNKAYNTLIYARANMTLIIRGGALVGNKQTLFNNNNGATYVVEPGAKFENLNAIVTVENGTYTNFSATFTNCTSTLDKVFLVGDNLYSSLQNAIDNAVSGDIIYVIGDYNLITATTIPADKELTLMAKGKDVTITSCATLTNNSKLSILGGENGETLTIQSNANRDMINAYADIIIGENVEIYDYAKGKNSIIVPKAVINLTIKTGATLGYANYVYYNNNGATYTIETGAKFVELTNIVYNKDVGTVDRKLVYENVTNPLTNNTCIAMVNDTIYNSLQDAIDNAVSGDTVYIMDNIILSTAVTIPADKELTIMPYDGDFTITQSALITNNSKLTISGNGEYTLTIQASKAMDQFNAYADIVIDNGVTVYGYAKGSYSIIVPKVEMTLTVKTGATMGYANYVFNNATCGTYVVETGTIFENATYIVANKNGTYETLTATFINCDNTLDKPFLVGENAYDTIEEAINAASNGDTIYLLNNVKLSGTKFPAGKELTIMPYNKDVTITVTAEIFNYGTLTLCGNGEHELIITRTGNIDLMENGGTLNLNEGVVFKGVNNNTYAIIYNNANGVIHINEGAVLSENYNGIWTDGVVYVHSGVIFRNLTNKAVYVSKGSCYAAEGIVYENTSNQLTVNWTP